MHRLLVSIKALPVEVPVGDIHEMLYGPVGQSRRDRHLTTQDVHVREDSQQGHVKDNGQAGADLVILSPRRDMQAGVDERVQVHWTRDGAVIEVNRHLRMVSLRLAVLW